MSIKEDGVHCIVCGKDNFSLAHDESDFRLGICVFGCVGPFRLSKMDN
jgi:hypothetical protein